MTFQRLFNVLSTSCQRLVNDLSTSAQWLVNVLSTSCQWRVNTLSTTCQHLVNVLSMSCQQLVNFCSTTCQHIVKDLSTSAQLLVNVLSYYLSNLARKHWQREGDLRLASYIHPQWAVMYLRGSRRRMNGEWSATPQQLSNFCANDGNNWSAKPAIICGQ